MQMQVAVLDYDPAHAAAIAASLGEAAYRCETYKSGKKLIERLQFKAFDLLILEWAAYDLTGKEVLKWVRQNLRDSVPVLFMTSRGSACDMASILAEGADDYVVKPVPGNVLANRVGALLGRAHHGEPQAARQIRLESLTFDLDTRFVSGDQVAVQLSTKAFDLALLFFRNLDRALSREEILDEVWSGGPEIPSRTIDTHVAWIRKKLDLRADRGYSLNSIYRYGYCLERVQSRQRVRTVDALPAAHSTRPLTADLAV